MGVKYRIELNDRKNTDWKVEISLSSYAGGVIDLRTFGSSPLKLLTKAPSSTNKFDPICTSTLTIDVVSDYDYQLSELMYANDQEYEVKLWSGGGNKFSGYLLSGIGGEIYTQPPYKYTIKAVDGLGLLKTIPYTHDAGTDVVRCSDILTHIIEDQIGSNISFYYDNTNVMYPLSLSPIGNETSIYLTYTNQQVFVDEEMSCYEVLQEILLTNMARIYQYLAYYVIEYIPSLEAGTAVNYRVRNTGTYSDVVAATINQPLTLHTDCKLVGGAKISSIEAPIEITVKDDRVDYINLLETSNGLIGWGSLNKWSSVFAGSLPEASDTNGFAAYNSWNTQTIDGDTVLGIGPHSYNNRYYLSVFPEKTNITAVVDNTGELFTLTFTNTTVSAPSWTISNYLSIKGRFNYEITSSATAPSGGVSTIQIRIKEGNSIPNVGDVINGVFDICKALEVQVALTPTLTPRVFNKSTFQYLELSITYATQYKVFTAYGATFYRPDATHYIGVLAIKNGGALNTADTFDGEIWGNLAQMGVNTYVAQTIQLEQTEHEQFITKKIKIPLTWSFPEDGYIHLALPASYGRGMVIKDINLTLKNTTENNLVSTISANNSTNLNIKGKLFDLPSGQDNIDYSYPLGIMNSSAQKYTTYLPDSTGKAQQIMNILQDHYDDNLQVFQGTLDGVYYFPNIIKDPKNFDRIFMSQEFKIDFNQALTTVKSIELLPGGYVAAVVTLTGVANITLPAHIEGGASSSSISLTNSGNIGFKVKGTSGSHFINKGVNYIKSGEIKNFTILSEGGTDQIYSETISYQEIHGHGTPKNVEASVIVYATNATFYVNDTPTSLGQLTKYDYVFVSNEINVPIVSVHTSTINVNVNGVLNPTPTVLVLGAGASSAIQIKQFTTALTTQVGNSYPLNASDLTNGWADTISHTVDVIVKALGESNIYSISGGITITVNHIRVNGGPWVNLPSGTVDFYSNDTIEWEVVATCPGFTSLTMNMTNRSGGTISTYTSGGSFNNTLTLDTASPPGSWSGGSIYFDLSGS